MKSMTGYAYLEEASEGVVRAVEIKGYNSRYLDITLTLPSTWARFEPYARALVAAACKRGKIDVNIKAEYNNDNFSVRLNINAVRAYLEAYRRIAAEADRAGVPRSGYVNIERFLTLPGVAGAVAPDRADDAQWPPIAALLSKALARFNAERLREGTHTLSAIKAHIDAIDSSRLSISRLVPTIEAAIKKHILKRFQELSIEADPNRVLQEVAILLMKYTVAEELSRLEAHCVAFNDELTKQSCSGKRLEFLTQEMNREINTIGSKSCLVEVSAIVVSMKDALENIREQLRNIE
jgi:uncharacterized protein (TIGR00255 family)